MRILFVTRHIDRSEAYLLSKLFASGVDLRLFCHPQTRNLEQLSKAGIPISLVELNSRFEATTIYKLRRMLRRQSYDIVHAVDSRALANSLWATLGIPVKIVAYRGTLGNLSHWDPAAHMAHLNRRIDRIICVSHAVRGYLNQIGVSPEKLVTIHKGHDPLWYEGLSGLRLEELGLPAGAFVVGCAANARPLKGIDVLIKAFHDLDDPKAHLLIVGEVRDRRLRGLAADGPAAKRIHLAGFRPDAAALMGQVDVFVMPSLRREGFPRAVIEAMAQRVPVIVTSVGGMPEMVDDRKEGLVIPPNDPQALAQALRFLREKPELRREMGRQARRKVEQDFHIERTYEKLFMLYKGLVD
jgi:glycosyltransferase involved in cell wall biosynthesis